MLLFTADNYPAIMYEAISCEEFACGLVPGSAVFVSFAWIGHVILISVTTAVIFEIYKRQQTIVVLGLKVDQRRAILSAFTLLDTDCSGRIDKVEFGLLLKALRPKVDEATVDVIFDLLDCDGSGSLTLSEFTDLCEVIMLKMRQHGDDGTWWGSLNELHSPAVKKIVSHGCFEGLSMTILGVYVAMLVIVAQPGDNKHIEQVVEQLFLALFTAESVFKLVGLGLYDFRSDSWNRLDVLVLTLSYASMIVDSLYSSRYMPPRPACPPIVCSLL